jgi:hypothetical protein
MPNKDTRAGHQVIPLFRSHLAEKRGYSCDFREDLALCELQ